MIDNFKKLYTFVPTNIVVTIMRIEEIIKSTVDLSLAKKVLLNIFFTNNLVNDKLNLILKPYDLSPEQLNVLRILRGQKGKLTNMFEIQDRMIAKTSNTTRLVDKLLLKDFVTRDICKDNRRKIEVKITAKGLELLNEIDPLLLEHENFFANKLTNKELTILNELLEKYRS